MSLVFYIFIKSANYNSGKESFIDINAEPAMLSKNILKRLNQEGKWILFFSGDI